MKSAKIYKLLLALIIVSLVFNSCSKEDDIMMNNNEGTNSNSGQNSKGGEITVYRVNGDNIEKIKDYKVTGKDLEYQKDVAKHQEIWELVKKIVPPSHRKFLDEFIIVNGEKSGVAGYAGHTKDDLTKWIMGLSISIADQDGADALQYVTIHEFGHILTLNNTQINHSIAEGACTNYLPPEGCTKKESYINKLYQGYWADIWGEFTTTKDAKAFYNKYKDRFVSEYASTVPGEDIAEVFASFVYDDKPSGATKAQEKILLMHNSNELTEIRKYIRKNLGLSAKSNSSSKLQKQRTIFKNKGCKK